MKRENVVLWVAAFLLVGVWIGAKFSGQPSTSTQVDSKLVQFFSYLESEYVDSLDIDALAEQAMDYILSDLDPHSTYITADDGAQMSERMNGGFTGIGVEFAIKKDTLVFVHVMTDGPAEEYGIRSGDRVFAIDGDTIVGPSLTNAKVTSLIKGPTGSFVDLSIRRANKQVTASVKRGQIPIQSVFDMGVKNGIGYVRVERFAETTHDEFVSHLKALEKDSMRALVIDLRDNPGGYLHEAVAMADEFLTEGQNIVTTRYRNGEEHTSKAYSGERYEDLPVHILINENSASASEVFTGALQDHDRAVVYGKTSYGKGLVQEDKYLGDGSKVRLTVAYYYTPSGRSIQKPYKEGKPANEGVFLSDSGRVLATAGGIEPDVELANDSASYFWTFSYGTLDAFAFDYVDSHRDHFDTLSVDQGYSSLVPDRGQLESFLEYGGYGIAMEDLSKEDEEALSQLLQAAIARNYFGYDAYKDVLLEYDPVLLALFDQARSMLQ
ncbi:MAG: putative CtpA-like serine protease [Cryomorphaceae bacterium]|nr:MAG: putative CtpA-like serine protease [Cryomorphaceae bacterium]